MRHLFTPEQRQAALEARRRDPKEPLKVYTVRVRAATYAALRKSGSTRVKNLLEEFVAKPGA